MKAEHILDFISTLEPEERQALQTAGLMGTTFSLDHLLETSTIKSSKLLQRMFTSAKESRYLDQRVFGIFGLNL